MSRVLERLDGLRDAPEIQRILLSEGFNFASTQYFVPVRNKTDLKSLEEPIKVSLRKAQPHRYSSGLVELPIRFMTDVHAFRTLDLDLSTWLELLELAIKYCHENKLVWNFCCHPVFLAVKDPYCHTIKTILEIATSPSVRCWITDNYEVWKFLRRGV